MFKSVLFSLIGLLISVNLSAQCVPDENFVPVESNYGLSPDTLADGFVNQNYSQDLTFFLPLDTLVDIEGFGETLIAFEDYHITSISLPIGLSWECNNSENQCHYNPTETQYGCVNLYGVPLEYGEFEVNVTVVATHELSWAVGVEEISFSLPLTILPNTSANDGFSMANYSGCAPLTVDFINNNSALAAYYWDFGNGNENSLENPPSQLYAEAGVYEVHYMAYSSSESLYFLSSVQISNASGWSGDFDDAFGALNPDPYFKLYDGEGNEIYGSSVQVDNSFPVSWELDNIPLTDQNYTITAWDEDGVTSDDNLGSVSFNGLSSSSTITNGDLVIEYTIFEVQPFPTADITDTIYVYESPVEHIINYDETSVLLSSNTDSLDLNYQWYFNQSPIPGANSLSYTPTNSGFYYLLVTNAFGCSVSSEELLIVICQEDYAPEIQLSTDTLSFPQSSNYDYQWFFEGQEIVGANTSIYIAQEEGNYSLTLSDQWGCKFVSENVLFTMVSLHDFFDNKLTIFPNPAQAYISVNVGVESSPLSFNLLEVYDMQGRKVLSQELWKSQHQIDVRSLTRGTYIVKVYSKGQQLSQRIVLN